MIPAVKPDLIVISASTCAESWAWYMTGNHLVSYIGPSAVDGGQFFLCPLFIIFFLWESKAMKLIVECSSKIVCDKNGFSKFPTFLGTYTILRIPYYNPLFLLFSPWNVFFLPARVDMSTICYVSELSGHHNCEEPSAQKNTDKQNYEHEVRISFFLSSLTHFLSFTLLPLIVKALMC